MKSDVPDQDGKPSGGRASALSQPTIRSRLLLAVNVPLAALVAISLSYDYSRELSQCLQSKQIALEDEAKTVLPAVLQVRHHGASSVQQYIDSVCSRMQDVDSPGHHIAIELGDEIFQAATHHRASPEILATMRDAMHRSSRRASRDESELVVGFHKRDGAIVYISESMENVRRSVLGDILRRLIGFVALAAVAAAVVNVVLLRVVSKPLDQMVQTVQEIGKGQLGVQTASYRTAELDYLAREINVMSTSLAAADRDHKMQMAKARDIQRNLLPQDIDAPGFDVAHLFEPADEVGGDYYDVLPLRDGSWLFCVADVTGHGVPAALTAAMLKALLLQAAENFTSPAEMMHFINHRFTAVSLVGDFVTMTLVRADPRTSMLTYASAGHEPAWLRPRIGPMRELSSTGTIVGIDVDAAWDEMAIDVTVGDALLIVTDGVSETLSREGTMFGRQQMARVFAESNELSAAQTAGRINEALKEFRGDTARTDDVTLVLIEVSSDQIGCSDKPT